jgi:hypothetical protein
MAEEWEWCSEESGCNEKALVSGSGSGRETDEAESEVKQEDCTILLGDGDGDGEGTEGEEGVDTIGDEAASVSSTVTVEVLVVLVGVDRSPESVLALTLYFLVDLEEGEESLTASGLQRKIVFASGWTGE